MRSRREAELAQLVADTRRLDALVDDLDAAKARGREMRAQLRCTRSGDGEGGATSTADGGALRMSVAYTRGAASVRVAALELAAPAVYAVVGPNGAGKSSLFALLRACASGGGGGHVPSDIAVEAGAALALPAGDVALVSQRQYCPLHSRPIEWLAHALPPSQAPPEPPEALAARAAELAAALRFGGGANLSESLQQEHEDYCGTLSGGQRAKLDLLSQVFLRPSCPALLLLDEAFAPLDPASKALVMRRLRSFCAHSLVLVIYHGDDADDGADSEEAPAAQGQADASTQTAAPAAAASSEAEVCAVGDGFFDGIVGFSDDGDVTLVQRCN